MTGFGKANFESSDVLIDVSVKAVNGRYLEIKIHGPKIYNALESEIRKKISPFVKRGTLDIYVNRRSLGATDPIVFNEKLAKKWLGGFSKMAMNLGLEKPKQAEILLQVPELIKVEESQKISAKEKAALLKVIADAVSRCAKVRFSEGKSLKSDLNHHIDSLSKRLSKMKKMRSIVANDLAKKYEQKLEKLNIPGEVEPQRLAQEVVILIDKTDITEELQRLDAHLEAIKKLFGSTESIGKKLDFYAQELLREVNTIGSKCTHAELTGLVVDCKGFIEKYREQVQNVE